MFWSILLSKLEETAHEEYHKNVVPALDPLNPMKCGSSQAKPQTAHITQSKLKPATPPPPPFTLYCTTICVGIALEDFIYCWFQPIIVVFISIDNVVFLQRALVSVDVGSTVGLLVRSMPTIHAYARVMGKLPNGSGALMGKTYGWKMISQMRRQLMVLLQQNACRTGIDGHICCLSG